MSGSIHREAKSCLKYCPHLSHNAVQVNLGLFSAMKCKNMVYDLTDLLITLGNCI